MNKRIIYIGIGALILIALAVAGFYLQNRNSAAPTIEEELTSEEESLSEDAQTLEEMEKATELENLDQDLMEISEETTPPSSADITSIENLADELNTELDSFSADLNDLGGFENNPEFDNFDADLNLIP